MKSKNSKKGRKAMVTEEQFIRIVESCNVPGDWELQDRAHYRYCATTGRILNWWPTTKRFNFQGVDDGGILEQRFIKALAEHFARFQLFPD
jgi:hypothetical protein